MDLRCCMLLAVVFVAQYAVGTHAVQLKAEMQTVDGPSGKIVVFRCTAERDQMYYLNHVITWSKIGRDGREKYLSINWDLVQHARYAGYEVASQIVTENSTLQTSPYKKPEMYFVLSKGVLSTEDHGEYICRLYDYDRNVLAEKRLPVVVFENSIALSPYKIETRTGQPFTTNCMYNNVNSTTDTTVVLSHHVQKDGSSTRVAENGRLIQANFSVKYDVASNNTSYMMNHEHNIITIKAPTKADEGHIVCELVRNNTVIASTNASVHIDIPQLHVSPLYFLQVPMDSVAHFTCECDIRDENTCSNNKLAWSLVQKHTREIIPIYADGKLLVNSKLYDVSSVKNGTGLNLTINGVRLNETEGDYICLLMDKSTSTELAHASIPVSVNPIALGALTLMDNWPKIIKFLCAISGGSHWNTHYLETHSIIWRRKGENGEIQKITDNDKLQKGFNNKKFSVKFNLLRHFSILIVKNPSKLLDFGEYSCELYSKINNAIIKTETLHMYGKGNTTTFTGSYGFKA